MAGDVEEFLRRLIEKQLGQQQPQPQRPVQQRPVPQRPPAAPRRPVPKRLKAEIIEDVVEVIDAEPVRGESVGKHVAQHLDAAEFQSRTGRLGAGVREEEAAMQSHFRETFGGGPKGNLVTSTAGAVTGAAPSDSQQAATTAAAAIVSGPSLASQVLNTIGSPNDLRRAFILGEVLRRPNFDELFP